jgi:hypothetical protein
MAREKNWNFNEALWSVGGDTQNQRGQKFLLMLKSWLVTYGGWRVIGSCDTTVVEYEGITSGFPYGGESTGPYDCWEGVVDLIQQSAEGGSNFSWCVLLGPASAKGQPYFVIAYLGSDSQYGTFYFHPNKPSVGVTPMNTVPTTVPFRGFGHSNTQAWVYTGDTNELQRAHLSASGVDGSFVLLTSATNSSRYTGLFMFHMLAQDDALNSNWWAFPATSYLHTNTSAWAWLSETCQFRCNHPDWPQTSQVAAVCAPYYGAGTRMLATMTGADAVDNKMAAFPAYLFCAGESAAQDGEGMGAIIGRVEDMFLCPEGLANGDTSSTVGLTSDEYFCFESLWWLPSASSPEYGP